MTTESIHATFVAMLTALKMCKKLVCMNLVTTESVDEKPKGSHKCAPNNDYTLKSEVPVTLYLSTVS